MKSLDKCYVSFFSWETATPSRYQYCLSRFVRLLGKETPKAYRRYIVFVEFIS